MARRISEIAAAAGKTTVQAMTVISNCWPNKTNFNDNTFISPDDDIIISYCLSLMSYR